MNASSAKSSDLRGPVLVIAVTLLLALLLGAAGALVGWVGQILFLTLLLPAVLLVMDYRFGLIMLIVLMPFAASPIIPKAGPLNVINVLLAGVCGLYLLRMALLKMTHREALLPVPRELLWFYIVPMTVATVIGTTHLGEIPPHYLMMNEIEAYGIPQYWISQFLKQMLVVFMACVCAAAVVEHGKGLRFVAAAMFSGVLFVLGMCALIAVTGISLDRLKDSRAFLQLLGRHNNEAGVMLLGVFGPALFMRPFVQRLSARLVLGAVVALTGLGIVLTFSRGAFLGLAAMVAMYVFHFRRLKTALGVLTVVSVLVAFAPDAVWDRLGRGLDEATSSTSAIDAKGDELTAGRAYVWKQLAPEILRSPLWGRGLQSTQWSNHVKTSSYHANHPHNMYLEILMDLGLLGAATMFLFYRYVWRSFRGLARHEGVPPPMRGYFLGASAAFVGMLIYGISNGHPYPAPEQIFFWISVGLAIGYSARAGQPVGDAARPLTAVERGRRLAELRARGGWKPT
jgi:O-antigen ligase